MDWRRFELLAPEKEKALLELLERKQLDKQDLLQILSTICLRQDIPRPRFSYDVTTTPTKTMWNFSPGVIGQASSLYLKRMPNGGVDVLLNGHEVNDVIAYNVELGRVSMPSITIKVALSDASVDNGVALEFDGKMRACER